MPYSNLQTPFGLRNFVAGASGPKPFGGSIVDRAKQQTQHYDEPVDLPTLPQAPPNPFGPGQALPGGPMDPTAGVMSGGASNRLNLPQGADRPMPILTKPQIPSGFDPTVSTPFSATYGGPKLNTAAALQGLAQNQSRPSAMGPYGSMEELYKQASGNAGNAGWSQSMAQRQLGMLNQDEDFERAQEFGARKTVGTALTQQHPAIQGLAELESQRAALPKQLEAQGRIMAEREQARGIMGAAGLNASSRERAARIAGLAPLLAQLGAAQERGQQSAVDNLDDWEGPNAQAIRALQQLLGGYIQNPVFDQDE